MFRTIVIAALIVFIGAVTPHAATITIVNSDGAGEGFNDPTVVAPIGGNPGTTIGQQRLNVFQEAADIWGALLPSAVDIRVTARFNPQSCDATSAVLGSAGPIQVFRDFAGAEVAGTWYHVALANKLAGADLSVGTNDISATFNSSIDNNNNCLNGTNWYYGLDGNEGGDVELLPVVLHELGHGLGFSTLVSQSGQEFNGEPDIYETFLLDNTTGLHWDDMSPGQRATSAVNTGNVVWDGPAATGMSDDFLGGTPVIAVNVGALPSPITIGTAGFGPALTEVGVTGDVVLVDDGVGTITDGCESPFVNAAAIAGNIALIDRGTCAFTIKAANAQAAGAIAVIIANNVGTGAIGLGGTDPTITIPTVSVSLADGNLIKAELGGGVNVTIQLDPNDLAGADANGRVQIYTPNPFEGGSSVSHWDTAALPNLLMEPAISGSLSSSVDLTLAHFDDIGWLDLPTGIGDDFPTARVTSLAVLPNYPNPFNPNTTIEYAVPDLQEVNVSVYDVQGRLVRSLVNRVETAGVHQVAWQARDNNGNPVTSGVYFVRITSGADFASRKIVLLK